MSPRSQQDFFAGLLFTVLGGGFAWGATTYQVGKAASMGPGYFPLLLGIILALMGMAIVAKSFMHGAPDGAPLGRWAWRPLFMVRGANVGFRGLLVGEAVFALVSIASLPGERFVLKEVLVLSAILALGSYAAFVKLLGLQFPVWPAFITG